MEEPIRAILTGQLEKRSPQQERVKGSKTYDADANTAQLDGERSRDLSEPTRT